MKRILFLWIGILCLLFTACSGQTSVKSVPVEENSETSSAEESSASETSAVPLSADLSDYFTERDLSTDYEITEEIALSDGFVTITKDGTYHITGTLTGGQIIIDATDTAKIQLILDNVTITNDGACIYVKNADKVFITTAAGSENTLTTTGEAVTDGDTNVDGTIFAKDDLTLNGSGTLTVISEQTHGIVAKDDLKIAGGTYLIQSAKKGLDVNDSVRIASGDITIEAGTDAIHVENTDDTSKGYIYMASGTLNLTSAEGDGMDASGSITILDGIVNILAGGGYTNGEVKYDWFGPGQQGTTNSDSASLKGIKSNQLITISGGTFQINSADDSLHTNGDIEISGGTFTLGAGDDAIHADYTLTITDGAIEILTSHEGLEGYTIDIQGGSISLYADDDGMNAAGSGSPTLKISGSTIYLNSSGDGLDSNGSMEISGGTIIVDGPSSDGNGALDYDGSATVTGGTLIALGSSGMAMNFSSSSTQGSILYNCGQQSEGTTVTLTDASGQEIVSYTSGKSFSSVVITSPQIQTGQTYTLTIGSSSTTIEMTSLVYGEGSGFGMGGFGGGGRGRR